jgi:hypothetical protein
MSLIYQQDGSVAATKTLRFLVRDGSTAGTNAAIKVFDGVNFVAYTIGGTAVVIDGNTNVAVIQGPGEFEIVITASRPFSMYASLPASIRKISGF